MIADQGDKAFRRVLGDTLQAAVPRIALIVAAAAVILATIAWVVRS